MVVPKYESGCGEVETELEARPGRERQGNAARDPKCDQVTKPTDELALHLCDQGARPGDRICQQATPFVDPSGLRQ